VGEVKVTGSGDSTAILPSPPMSSSIGNGLWVFMQLPDPSAFYFSTFTSPVTETWPDGKS
jgi:hypothetical protein